MKLQEASQKEIKRITVGTGVCFLLMIAVFALLSLFELVMFDYRVLLGGVAGSLIAVGNFTILCLTIQSAAKIDDKKQMKMRFQLSYNCRLALQAGWVVAAYFLSCFNVFAAAVPLLFPTVVIWYLQSKGQQINPSQRKNSPSDAAEVEELDSFEV